MTTLGSIPPLHVHAQDEEKRGFVAYLNPAVLLLLFKLWSLNITFWLKKQLHKDSTQDCLLKGIPFQILTSLTDS